jgi:hypothetical protein
MHARSAGQVCVRGARLRFFGGEVRTSEHSARPAFSVTRHPRHSRCLIPVASCLGGVHSSAAAVRVTPEKGTARTGRCNWSICGSAPPSLRGSRWLCWARAFFYWRGVVLRLRPTPGNHGCILICESVAAHSKLHSRNSRPTVSCTNLPALTKCRTNATIADPIRTTRDSSGPRRFPSYRARSVICRGCSAAAMPRPRHSKLSATATPSANGSGPPPGARRVPTRPASGDTAQRSIRPSWAGQTFYCSTATTC